MHLDAQLESGVFYLTALSQLPIERLIYVVKQEGSRRVTFRQSLSRMRNGAATIEQTVSEKLPDLQLPVLIVELNRPPGLSNRLGCGIKTKAHAVLALRSVRVPFKPRARLVRRHIGIRRLHSSARDIANDRSKLMMEKSGDRLIVRDEAAWNLTVS